MQGDAGGGAVAGGECNVKGGRLRLGRNDGRKRRKRLGHGPEYTRDGVSFNA